MERNNDRYDDYDYYFDSDYDSDDDELDHIWVELSNIWTDITKCLCCGNVDF